MSFPPTSLISFCCLSFSLSYSVVYTSAIFLFPITNISVLSQPPASLLCLSLSFSLQNPLFFQPSFPFPFHKLFLKFTFFTSSQTSPSHYARLFLALPPFLRKLCGLIKQWNMFRHAFVKRSKNKNKIYLNNNYLKNAFFCTQHVFYRFFFYHLLNKQHPQELRSSTTGQKRWRS